MSAQANPTQRRDTPNPLRFWPVWKRREGQLASLAQYVSPDALRTLHLVSSNVRDLRAPERDQADADRVLAERLFATLRDKRIEYAIEPWVGERGTQQIRDPRWLIEDAWGTCLDIAATYAAMCLEARVAPMLALADGHAFVVVAPGRLHTEPGARKIFALAGCVAGEADGVLRLEDRVALLEAIDDGSVMAIDPTVATYHGSRFEDALEAGRAQARAGLQLVDVPWLQQNPLYRPHAPPATRPTIRLHVPGDQGVFEKYDGHRALVSELRELSGTVVLIGPAGQGKSTIARRIAEDAPFGAGWFLNASEPQTLLNSLAEAELSELNEPVTGLERVDRAGFAQSARNRLAESTDRWIVVLDNADGDPTKLAPHLPQPRDRQLVLITTTNRGWERLPGLTIRHLPPIDDDRVARDLGREMVEPVAGRPLLLNAFGRLINHTGLDSAQVAASEPKDRSIAPAQRGPATLWAALRDCPSFNDSALEISLHAAYLPPDHQPAGLLVGFAPGGHDAVEVLVDGGLLMREASGVLRMHRLFGAAVREDLEQGSRDMCDDAVIVIAISPAAIDVLDRHGDLATVMRLADRLHGRDAGTPGVDETLGTALHAVADLLERHGHTDRSAETYAGAERHLQDRPDLLADCLHARARTVFRKFPKDEARLRDALEDSRRAERIGLERGAGRYLAMQGLLMQKLAMFPQDGETVAGLLRDALAVIEDADRRRHLRTDISAAELARSRYNLAGIRIDLAKADRGRASVYLDTSATIYDEVRKRRRRIYQRDVHAHIATCTIGLGIVSYYRATLISATAIERTRWLREATNHAVLAIQQYEAQEGLIDLAESSKAARFLAKVALARHAPRTRPRPAVDAATREVIEELELAPVQPLPPDGRGLVPAIAAWAGSPALVRLVEAFGGQAPRHDELGDLLDWLDDFSLRWDSRAGQERNLVKAEQLAPGNEAVVMSSAHALGLVGTLAPASSHYDHVLILGGLLRACFARSLHAANLLRAEGDGEDGVAITASSVTALGGYRPLRGDELDLVATFGRHELTDEFDAMDAGVHEAFGLTQPVDERGESSDIVGASWRVREYVTAADLPVHVIAAPSEEPGTRRANTADSYGWFATQHANLSAGQRILLVTTDIYARFQHADALRMLALPYGVEIDTVGIQAGHVDLRLKQEFAPHNYLQEIRSTIRALRALHEASSMP